MQSNPIGDLIKNLYTSNQEQVHLLGKIADNTTNLLEKLSSGKGNTFFTNLVADLAGGTIIANVLKGKEEIKKAKRAIPKISLRENQEANKGIKEMLKGVIDAIPERKVEPVDVKKESSTSFKDMTRKQPLIIKKAQEESPLTEEQKEFYKEEAKKNERRVKDNERRSKKKEEQRKKNLMEFFEGEDEPEKTVLKPVPEKKKPVYPDKPKNKSGQIFPTELISKMKNALGEAKKKGKKLWSDDEGWIDLNKSKEHLTKAFNKTEKFMETFNKDVAESPWKYAGRAFGAATATAKLGMAIGVGGESSVTSNQGSYNKIVSSGTASDTLAWGIYTLGFNTYTLGQHLGGMLSGLFKGVG